MLDAAGPALALETVAVSTAIAPTSDDPAATPPVANLNGNTAPSDIVIQTPIVINENGVATLSLTFNDPDALDAHTIEVDWQDGTTESFSLAAGVTSFSTTHQYLDDNLPGPATEDYDVAVRVIDSAGEFADETSKITVLNVAPANLQISPVTPINENGVATLQLSFDDPGTVDDHTVEVDWGDGSAVQVFTVPTGDRTFSATHKYLDDNPTGTASDSYAIHVRLTDDDLGETTAATVAKVNNVAPFNVQIQSIQPVNEDGVASLAIAFNDPGTLDSHTVEVDWGDGTVETLSVAVGARNLAASHQYLDDNPTGTSSDVYAVKVRVLDDDLGEGSATKGVTVVNVAPSNVQINPIAAIDENGVAVLNLAFNDPGTLDSHTVEVDWGDGTVETLAVAAGSQTFTANHQYLDDNPTGTVADVYTVNVKVRDDDGGQASGSATAKVLNVPPSNVVVSPVATITNEGTQVNLGIAFDDVGSQDTHQVEINWGDGNVTTATAVGHALNANHTYGDNGTYAVIVKVTDDDGGAGFGSAAVQVNNVAPSNVQIQPIAAIDENGVATLELTFDDPGTLDSHTVEVDWGDGTVETLAVAAGSRTFTATHQYLDDNPTGTSSDVYTVNVKVRDDDGGLATASQTVQVSNVAPSNVQIQPIAAIDENGVATLELTFDDPGTLDSHTVEVDWGDSTVETLAVAAGSRTFTATHQYLDDNPTGTSSDEYTVNVKVRDDDGGQATANSTVNVSNVAPSNVLIAPVGSSIAEGGGVNLGITFDDPGSQDSHQVEINWGDGQVTTGTATGYTFSASHVYADNGTYAVHVKVVDDDGGVGNSLATVFVANVAPSVTVVGPQTVNEGSLLSLTNIGQFTDPGFDNPLNAGNILTGGETTEEFTYEINWGDGSAVESGLPTIDQIGSEGNATAGSFDANHIYADNGVYTVTVTVKDDDGGVTVKQFQVTVQNVDPTLTFTNPSIVVDEGAPITLAGLGVGAADPGFDNDALGTQETFQGATVDWGDGSASDSLTVSVGAKGSAGNATTGVFAHAAHHYADNGIYTVTVRFKDDDGGFVDRTFTISVENVAPSLDLTTDVFVINEGDTLNLPNLGTFSDPGFNNPSNPSGASQESFKYTINWGDGTTETGVLPASVANGSPGVATIGTLVDSHLYADNDADNKYTITVTLEDDDGGTVTKAIEVTVLNVNPALNPIVATDVNTKGQTTLTLQFDDPGADEFDVVVDWGDTVETIHVPANSKGQPLTYTHTYSGPPDPLNPTADITITVQILDDDFGTPGVAANGASNVEAVAISQPGLGAEKFRIDTTPQVAILTFPDRQVVPLLRTNVDARLATTTTVDVGGGGGDARATSERFLELRVINPDGTEGPGYRLPAKVLNNLPALFRNLPDNHYKIFLVQSETNSRRLVIEVFVRNGKLIDPGDDSEGARDRPPTEESTTRPVDQQPAAAEQGEPAPVAGEPVEPQASSQWRHGPRSSTAIYHSATLAGVAIALSGAGKNSFRTLEEALARAKPDQWKRLRSAATHRPKKPR
ncbi:beta strand repeat-containing protein [Lacipirellula limnantheis]|uniref:PKD domain-containing protein n=1 Tax=Lacipirellula limnantheis TaxID=2528024 RepID=A0A517U5E8_9BACT|nr:PKD domain-containing protein [Lacipirellula limnantheis]QDT75847.1 hypothetical protein I41_50900 [Lacipirellula limnantheis]